MKIKKLYFLIVLFLCGLSVGNLFAAAPAAGRLGQELRDAARAGNEPEVEELIAAGADVNAADEYGSTALIFAAARGRENIAEKLLQVDGIDVNAANQGGWTALMFAAEKGHENIVKMLLQVDGIDVNTASQSGWTALQWAAKNGHENIVKDLLQVKGIDVNATDEWGNTALIFATINGHENIVKMLLDAGADKAIQTMHNQTAEAMARESDHEDLANMIRDYVRSGRTVKSAGKTE